jgi:hypothetical protein
VVGAEVHDLTDTDDRFRRHLVEEARGRSYPFSIVEDYHRRKGWEAFAFVRATPRLHLGVNWRADRHESLPVVADDRLFLVFDRAPRANPPAGEGEMRSLLLTARFAAAGALYGTDARERRSFLVADPYGEAVDRAQRVRADVSVEWADRALGGAFDFTRVIAHVRAARPVGARSVVNARALLGLTGGAPPPQRRFALGGAGTLRGYALKEFAGRHAALVTAEWMFEPGLRRAPALLAFYDGGAAWSPDADGAGWKSDLGVGLEWPAGGSRARRRVDLAFPLQPTEGRDTARVHALLRVPF